MEAYILLKVRCGGKDIEHVVSRLPIKPHSCRHRDSFTYEMKYDDVDCFDLPVGSFEEILAQKDLIIELVDLFDVEMCVVIYTNGQINPGVHVTAEDIKRLADFGLPLDFDIYITPSDEEYYRSFWGRLCEGIRYILFGVK